MQLNLSCSSVETQHFNLIKTKININEEEATVALLLSIMNRPVKFLIDTGSSISLINNNCVKQDTNFIYDKKVQIMGATGHSATTLALVATKISIEDQNLEHHFHVYGSGISINADGILGWDFINKFRGNIDFENKKLILKMPQSLVKLTTQPKEVVSSKKFQGGNEAALEKFESAERENHKIQKIQNSEPQRAGNSTKTTENVESVENESHEIRDSRNSTQQIEISTETLKNVNDNSKTKPTIIEMDEKEKDREECELYNPYLRGNSSPFLKTMGKKRVKSYQFPNRTYSNSIQVKNLFHNTAMSRYVKTNVNDNQSGVIIWERCEQVLEINTNLETNNHLLCKTQEILPNVRIKNSVLVNKDNKIQIIIQNFNDFPVKLKQSDFKSLEFEETKNFNIFSFKTPKINDPNDRMKIILDKLNMTHNTSQEKDMIKQLCTDNTDCFFIDGDPINHTDLIEHSIELKPDSKPIFTKQYRLPESQKREIQQQLEKMEEEGIIEKCTASGWNSPLILVPKTDSEGQRKKYRLVVDFRKLNEATIPMKFPIPHIDSIIDEFDGAKFFSTLDLNGAFYQIKMREKDKHYTSFQNNFFSYQFVSMPQGLSTSPATMQFVANLLLKDLFARGVRIYMDDIVIFTKTLKEHIELLREIFSRLRRHNFKLKIEKCFFLKEKIEYLGFIISGEGSLPNPNKTECINKYPRPRTVTEVQRFLGLCNYYRKFINNFAKMAKPLYNLCCADVPFVWNQACENGFEDLKRAVSNPPVLAFPDFNETFVVHTDASNIAVAAVLSQLERPIQFASKTLNNAQKNYSTIEKELYAIIYALEIFRHYLLGFEFILYCDHKPLIYLFNTKRFESRMYRWKLQISDYRFKILYKQGAQNTVADALSRIETEKSQTLEEVLRNTDTHLLRALTRSKSRELEILTKIQNENNDTKSYENTLNKSTNMEKRNPIDFFYVEENNNVLINTDKTDHIFYIFQRKNCELKRKIEHKLGANLNLPDDVLNGIPYSIDKNRTIFILPQIPRDDERVMITKLTLQNIMKLCVDYDYNEISINIDIKNPQHYFEFKYLCREIFHRSEIKITFYLNKVMEVCTIEDINTILKTYHDSPLAGHVSFEKTKNSIRRYYSWPTMNEDIKKYCKTCEVCKKSKITKHTRSHMQITSTASYPFQKVYVDHVIVHKQSGLYKYSAILTCICELTKYAIAIKVQDLTALTAAKKLVKHVFLKHNIPATLVSDQGSAFTSQLFSEITKLFKIRKITTTPYRPNANIVERFHKTLSQLMTAIVHENPNDWVDHIDSAVFAYNNTMHSATGFTPHELLYGFNVQLPDKIKRDESPIYNYDNFHDEIRHKLAKNWRLAHNNIVNAKEKNKHQYDKHCNPIDVKVGDKVYVYREVRDHKYASHYDGPFTIEEVISPVTVMIRKKKKLIKIHKDKLIRA